MTNSDIELLAGTDFAKGCPTGTDEFDLDREDVIEALEILNNLEASKVDGRIPLNKEYEIERTLFLLRSAISYLKRIKYFYLEAQDAARLAKEAQDAARLAKK